MTLQRGGRGLLAAGLLAMLGVLVLVAIARDGASAVRSSEGRPASPDGTASLRQGGGER